MEVYLENISKNSNPKDNYYIVVNDTKSKIKNEFLPPLLPYEDASVCIPSIDLDSILCDNHLATT